MIESNVVRLVPNENKKVWNAKLTKMDSKNCNFVDFELITIAKAFILIFYCIFFK